MLTLLNLAIASLRRFAVSCFVDHITIGTFTLVASILAIQGFSTTPISQKAEEAKQQALLATWIENAGGWLSHKIDIERTNDRGQGLVAIDNISAGEVLVSLPVELSILGQYAIKIIKCSREVAAFFTNLGGFPNADQSHVHEIFSIMSLLLSELDNAASPYAPYFQHIRKHWAHKDLLRFPLFWNDELLAELDGTTASKVFEAGSKGVVREHHLMRKLCPQIRHRSLKAYKSTWAFVNSRITTYPGDPSAAGALAARQNALLPVFDLVNHHLPQPREMLTSDDVISQYLSHSKGRYGFRGAGATRNSSGHVQLWSDIPLSQGNEVTDVYGIKANEDFLWTWGFTVPWIHNLTCLSSVFLVFQTSQLPESAAPEQARIRKAELAVHGIAQLSFRVDACLGSGFHELLAFARFWYTDAPVSSLQAGCSLSGPPLWTIPPTPGKWQLGTCSYTSAVAEENARRFVADATAVQLEGITGGSLEDDDQLLASGTLSPAWQDAVTVRRDEKYVLTKLERQLQKELAEGSWRASPIKISKTAGRFKNRREL